MPSCRAGSPAGSTAAWTFFAHDTSRRLSIGQWVAAPYNQDTRSTFSESEGC